MKHETKFDAPMLRVRCDEGFYEALDDIRAKRRPVLTRSDMIRVLVDEEHERVKPRRRKA